MWWFCHQERLSAASVSFLLDESDTVLAYENKGKNSEQTQSGHDPLMSALDNLNRVQQLEIIHGTRKTTRVHTVLHGKLHCNNTTVLQICYWVLEFFAFVGFRVQRHEEWTEGLSAEICCRRKSEFETEDWWCHVTVSALIGWVMMSCDFSDRLWLLMTSVSSSSSSRVVRDGESMPDVSTAPDDIWPPAVPLKTFDLSWSPDWECRPSVIFFPFLVSRRCCRFSE